MLNRAYHVLGTTRDTGCATFNNLKRLDIRDRVDLASTARKDFRSVLKAVDCAALDEIYFLTDQSSIPLSFESPAETIESIVLSSLNLLEDHFAQQLSIIGAAGEQHLAFTDVFQKFGCARPAIVAGISIAGLAVYMLPTQHLLLPDR